MKTVSTVAALRQQVGQWRKEGQRIAFVPTMGDLHRGHLSLVKAAQQKADRVVVSIFVNPLQFGENEDFDAYPRVVEADSEKLSSQGADLLFAPSVGEMYPNGQENLSQVSVPVLSDTLCGASRPGHFTGVATVVTKLFGMVQPDVALFGEKDYQQLLVIKKFTADLNLPVEIVGVPTCREDDGLAMSSRNGYLTPAERETAPTLYHCLQQLMADIQRGQTITSATQKAILLLEENGFRPDYIEVRNTRDLGAVTESDEELVVLAAAWLGKARLIDNIQFSRR